MEILESLISFPASGKALCGLAWDGTCLWHSDAGEQKIYRIHPSSGRVLKTLACPEVKTGLSFDGNNLWQVVGTPKRMKCLSPDDGTVLREITIEPSTGQTCGIEVDVENDVFWMSIEGTTAVLQCRNLTSGRILRQFSVQNGIACISFGLKWVWYTEFRQGLIIAVDPILGLEFRRYKISGKPTGLTWDGNQFWYADYSSRQLCAVGVTGLPE